MFCQVFDLLHPISCAALEATELPRLLEMLCRKTATRHVKAWASMLCARWRTTESQEYGYAANQAAACAGALDPVGKKHAGVGAGVGPGVGAGVGTTTAENLGGWAL